MTSRTARQLLAGSALAIGILCGCPAAGPQLPDEGAFDTLSEWGLWEGDLVALTPAPGVFGYEPTAPLWSGHTAKDRILALPVDGEGWGDAGGGWVVMEGGYQSRPTASPGRSPARPGRAPARAEWHPRG